MTLDSSDLQTITGMIRTFRDRKGIVQLSNTLVLNPQLITPTTNPSVYGPYYFNTQFSKTPVVVFNGYRNVQQNSTTSGGVPFVCQPYIDSFVFKGGAIVGMNVGVYGLTTAPPTLTAYTLAWIAIGQGSAYKNERQSSSYTQSYNNGQATNLSSDAQATTMSTQ